MRDRKDRWPGQRSQAAHPRSAARQTRPAHASCPLVGGSRSLPGGPHTARALRTALHSPLVRRGAQRIHHVWYNGKAGAHTNDTLLVGASRVKPQGLPYAILAGLDGCVKRWGGGQQTVWAHLSEGPVDGRRCKELDPRVQVVAPFPACSGVRQPYANSLHRCSGKPCQCSRRRAPHLLALLYQQGMPGSSATSSPGLKLLTPGPTSTTVPEAAHKREALPHAATAGCRTRHARAKAQLVVRQRRAAYRCTRALSPFCPQRQSQLCAPALR